MATAQEKKTKLLDEIRDLFGDTSVTQAETKDMLEEIAEETQSLADCIEDAAK